MKYSFESYVRYSEIGEDRNLTLNSVINYFQDCSTFHSEHTGVGIDYLQEKNRVWVLSSWQIVVDRYPKLCEKIKITTWPYAFKRFLGSRNFTMEDESGATVAYANSLWTYLDLETGMPANVSEQQIEAYTLEERYPMEYAPRKIKMPVDTAEYESFPVRGYGRGIRARRILCAPDAGGVQGTGSAGRYHSTKSEAGAGGMYRGSLQ